MCVIVIYGSVQVCICVRTFVCVCARVRIIVIYGCVQVCVCVHMYVYDIQRLTSAISLLASQP